MILQFHHTVGCHNITIQPVETVLEQQSTASCRHCRIPHGVHSDVRYIGITNQISVLSKLVMVHIFYVLDAVIHRHYRLMHSSYDRKPTNVVGHKPDRAAHSRTANAAPPRYFFSRSHLRPPTPTSRVLHLCYQHRLYAEKGQCEKAEPGSRQSITSPISICSNSLEELLG